MSGREKISDVSPLADGRGRARGRGFGLDSSEQRRPGINSNADRVVLSNSQASLTPKTTVSDSSVSTSTKSPLDAKAPEFVPSSTRSVRSLPELSVHAQEFVPLQHQQTRIIADHEHIINFLAYVLEDLLLMPSSYERSVNNITAFLIRCLTDNRSMTVACDVIFDWAVGTPNFSYICARLCENVANKVPNDHNGRFHQHMLKRCRQEFAKVDDLIVNSPAHASCFAIFLAELYSREVFRIDKVKDAVLDIIEKMVAKLDNDLAKTIGQILKMCGAHLEDALAKNHETSRMEALLSAITSKVSNSEGTQLSNTMAGLLKSVLTLRAANWGRSTSPIPNIPDSPAISNFVQEPIFYSMTGEHITREQAGYAEECLDLSSVGAGHAYGGIPDDLSGARGDYSESEDHTLTGEADDLDVDILVVDDDEEMTEDMWAAYERFEAEREQNLRNHDDNADAGSYY
ncbi:polyadenylate-binding protein-interacting protein 1-like [Watersipora subatra]|uniref:polyadenylate-binding protein-interacting protein 1-like n=1 Tax=Watersipora subatra TaxID=2589382 RepID=UPI00355B3E7E